MDGDWAGHGAGPEDDRPVKRRRLKGLDTSSLTQMLSCLHQCLERLLDISNEDKEAPQLTEVPVLHLEEEFERHWRLSFDCRAVGESSTASFLKRFPEVFKVRANGFQMMVAPAEDPNFEAAAEAGIEESHAAPSAFSDYSVCTAEQIASCLVGMVADERKASGAPLNFQYASNEVLRDLCGLLKNEIRAPNVTQNDLINMLLDPRPVQPQLPKETNQEARSKDKEDDKDGGNESRDNAQNNDSGGGGQRGRGNYNYSGYQARDKKGSDGRALCRNYNSGRCAYGDNCRFLHERDPDRSNRW